jgi:hypothetical protein
MPLRNLFQKLNQIFRSEWLLRIQILIITLIINLPLNSVAKDPEPTEKTSGSNIANILNKVSNEKIPDTKVIRDTLSKSLEKTAGQASDKGAVTAPEKGQEKNKEKTTETGPISKIVSSLIPKKSGPSLMFSTEEIEKVEQALLANQNNQPFITDNASVEKEAAGATGDEVNSCVYLGSILYHSPNSWAAWINGQKITNSDNKVGNEIYIKSINEDKANIVWTMSISKWKILTNQKSESGAPIGANNQVELNFNLSFNQTYMLNGGEVIEGRITHSSPAAATPGPSHNKALTDALKGDTAKKP